MRISDWSSDVCSSDLLDWQHIFVDRPDMRNRRLQQRACRAGKIWMKAEAAGHRSIGHIPAAERGMQTLFSQCEFLARFIRSEEHTSELQSLMRISYAVFCLKKKKHTVTTIYEHQTHTSNFVQH